MIFTNQLTESKWINGRRTTHPGKENYRWSWNKRGTGRCQNWRSTKKDWRISLIWRPSRTFLKKMKDWSSRKKLKKSIVIPSTWERYSGQKYLSKNSWNSNISNPIWKIKIFGEVPRTYKISMKMEIYGIRRRKEWVGMRDHGARPCPKIRCRWIRRVRRVGIRTRVEAPLHRVRGRTQICNRPSTRIWRGAILQND